MLALFSINLAFPTASKSKVLLVRYGARAFLSFRTFQVITKARTARTLSVRRAPGVARVGDVKGARVLGFRACVGHGA